jgi:hypothetical protein
MKKTTLTKRNARRLAAKHSKTRTHHTPGHCDCCGCELTEEDRRTSGEPTYQFWRSMISCCTNEHAVGYSNFGGRGVRVCEEWLNSFASFLKDAGDCPGPNYSLNLKDGDGHFAPGNVLWASVCPGEWHDGRHVSLDLERVRMELNEWAKKAGVRPSELAYRLLRRLPQYQ